MDARLGASQRSVPARDPEDHAGADEPERREQRRHGEVPRAVGKFTDDRGYDDERREQPDARNEQLPPPGVRRGDGTALPPEERREHQQQDSDGKTDWATEDGERG